MFRIIPWSEKLDLTDFYQQAEKKGFLNNASQSAMIDCFRNESRWAAWILYQNDRAIGSVAAHSFDDVMGPGSYRVLARTCTFGEARPNHGLITARKLIAEHQNFTDQFLLPVCISWAGRENLYATSNLSSVASQRLVHTIYFPTLEKLGIVRPIKEVFYRGTEQTVWKINVTAFETNLSKYPRWSLDV